MKSSRFLYRGEKLMENEKIQVEVAQKIWDIAKISPEHGNALIDVLGDEVYNKITRMQKG